MQVECDWLKHVTPLRGQQMLYIITNTAFAKSVASVACFVHWYFNAVLHIR